MVRIRMLCGRELLSRPAWGCSQPPRAVAGATSLSIVGQKTSVWALPPSAKIVTVWGSTTEENMGIKTVFETVFGTVRDQAAAHQAQPSRDPSISIDDEEWEKIRERVFSGKQTTTQGKIDVIRSKYDL